MKSLIEELNRVNGNVDDMNDPADQLFLRTQLDMLGLQILNSSFFYQEKHKRMMGSNKWSIKAYWKRFRCENFEMSMHKINGSQQRQNAHLHGECFTLIFWNL